MMKYLYTLITIISCITILSFCSSYNSDKVNHDLIQGKWILSDVVYPMAIYDTLNIDYSKEQTLLLFDGNKCIQYMPDLGDTIYFNFSIHDFELNLYQDSIKVSALEITTLTSDSLKLIHGKNERIYIRNRTQ